MKIKEDEFYGWHKRKKNIKKRTREANREQRKKQKLKEEIIEEKDRKEERIKGNKEEGWKWRKSEWKRRKETMEGRKVGRIWEKNKRWTRRKWNKLKKQRKKYLDNWTLNKFWKCLFHFT